MSNRILATIVAFAACAATCGPAMSAPRAPGACRVTGAEKLVQESGGANAICSAIERAMASQAPTVRYSAEVRVLSKSALSATVVANGRKLPEQQFAVTDRNLNPGSIERFARGLAEEVAKTGKSG